MIRKEILWGTDNVCVHERAHAISTDISTSFVLNGVGACVSLRNCFLIKIKKFYEIEYYFNFWCPKHWPDFPESILNIPANKQGLFPCGSTNNTAPTYYISICRPGIESISHRANHIFLHINYIQKDNMMHVFL